MVTGICHLTRFQLFSETEKENGVRWDYIKGVVALTSGFKGDLTQVVPQRIIYETGVISYFIILFYLKLDYI